MRPHSRTERLGPALLRRAKRKRAKRKAVFNTRVRPPERREALRRAKRADPLSFAPGRITAQLCGTGTCVGLQYDINKRSLQYTHSAAAADDKEATPRLTTPAPKQGTRLAALTWGGGGGRGRAGVIRHHARGIYWLQQRCWCRGQSQLRQGRGGCAPPPPPARRQQRYSAGCAAVVFIASVAHVASTRSFSAPQSVDSQPRQRWQESGP